VRQWFAKDKRLPKLAVLPLHFHNIVEIVLSGQVVSKLEERFYKALIEEILALPVVIFVKIYLVKKVDILFRFKRRLIIFA